MTPSISTRRIKQRTRLRGVALSFVAATVATSLYPATSALAQEQFVPAARPKPCLALISGECVSPNDLIKPVKPGLSMKGFTNVVGDTAFVSVSYRVTGIDDPNASVSGVQVDGLTPLLETQTGPLSGSFTVSRPCFQLGVLEVRVDVVGRSPGVAVPIEHAYEPDLRGCRRGLEPDSGINNSPWSLL